MPQNPVFSIMDENSANVYGAATANVPAGAATTVIKSRPGRLVSVLVTAAGTVVTTFYDNTAGSGLVIGVVPANAAVGSTYPIQMPATIGITAVGSAGSPQLTVCYS
ncbi:MAG: hypothetical protein JWO67_3203 [Streptosporangiaceae bacterium]|nr:hypothetical protein [Streptosporangiaceae bacterium]